MVDLLEASISTRVYGNAARSLENVPDVIGVLAFLKLNLEGIGIRTLALNAVSVKLGQQSLGHSQH
jgi:hypothetical protein